MTKRDISLKKRGTRNKKERATYLVVAEGRNKTETLYLSHFQVQGKDYYLRFVKAGSKTDAESLYKTLMAKWKELGLSQASGDKGFIVLDIDNDPQKAEKVLSLIQANRNEAISFIVSNPVFEVMKNPESFILFLVLFNQSLIIPKPIKRKMMLIK